MQERTRLPTELTALLRIAGEVEREHAWSRFVESYSRLILHVARSLGRDHDAVMDRYAFVLEQLRKDDCHRLRRFVADGRGKFSTWLTVVTRRLCLDREREKYGRVRGKASRAEPSESRLVRRRLADLVTAELDASRAGNPSGDNPEMDLRKRESEEALGQALGTLSPRDRLVLAMRFEDGRPAREVAEIMGYATPFHVYRHVNQVLERLREALHARGIHDAAP